jgi:hypothetical protein
MTSVPCSSFDTSQALQQDAAVARVLRHQNHRLLPRDTALPGNDAHYLDPMRGRTPWDVTKEHVVPILALLVSLTALLRR